MLLCFSLYPSSRANLRSSLLLFLSAPSSSEEDGAGVRSVNLDVTDRAVLVLQRQILRWTGWRDAADAMRCAVAFKAHLRHAARPQHSRVR